MSNIIQIIIGVIVAIIGILSTFQAFYKIGYDNREELFQSLPTTYVQAGVPILRIHRDQENNIVVKDLLKGKEVFNTTRYL